MTIIQSINPVSAVLKVNISEIPEVSGAGTLP
jgi:hypothetical protein